MKLQCHERDAREGDGSGGRKREEEDRGGDGVLILVSTAHSCCLAPKMARATFHTRESAGVGKVPLGLSHCTFELPACATPDSCDTQPYMRGARNSGMGILTTFMTMTDDEAETRQSIAEYNNTTARPRPTKQNGGWGWRSPAGSPADTWVDDQSSSRQLRAC